MNKKSPVSSASEIVKEAEKPTTQEKIDPQAAAKEFAQNLENDLLYIKGLTHYQIEQKKLALGIQIARKDP